MRVHVKVSVRILRATGVETEFRATEGATLTVMADSEAPLDAILAASYPWLH